MRTPQSESLLVYNHWGSDPGPTTLQTLTAPCQFSACLTLDPKVPLAFALTPLFPSCYPALLTLAAGYSVASTWGRGRQTSRM